MGDKDAERALSRRELLKRAGLGGAALLGGSLLGASVRDEASAAAPPDVYATGGGQMTVGDDVMSSIYGNGGGPPRGLDESALDAQTFPPRPDGQPAGAVRELEFRVEERLIEVAHEVFVEAWTYNGIVPGPIIRATEGDLLRIHLENRTGHSHSIHFQGRTVPRWTDGSRFPPEARRYTRSRPARRDSTPITVTRHRWPSTSPEACTE